jgi:hypothetical protein
MLRTSSIPALLPPTTFLAIPKPVIFRLQVSVRLLFSPDLSLLSLFGF